MDLELALEDLVNSVNTVDGLTVVDEKQEPGARTFTLVFTLGQRESKRNFGANRVTYYVGLTFSARKHDMVVIATKLKAVEDAITDDRRRGGNAQTTIIGEEWLPVEAEGREGVFYENFVGMVIYES